MSLNKGLIKSLLVVVIIALFLSGCQKPDVVRDSKGVEPLTTVFVSCDRPYSLKQDCSFWEGASREITIGKWHLKIAGSADGRVVMVMPTIGDVIQAAATDGMLEGLGLWTQEHNFVTWQANFYYRMIKRELNKKGITVTKAIPLVTGRDVDGYILELDGDGYSMIKKMSDH